MSAAGDTLLAGIDGGGSGCRCAVATADGAVLGRGAAGPANLTTDAAGALASVRAALDAALAAAGLDPAAPPRLVVHAGIAGVLGPEGAARIAEALPAARRTVSDDRATALAGALGRADGALLAVGTGVIAAAQREGVARHVGGWGMHVSDQGSGAWLGRALLTQALLAHDGVAPHSALTRRVMADHREDPRAVVAFAASARPQDYAAQARPVADAAEAGDATARMLRAAGAGHLERCLDALALRPGDPLCLSGGLGPRYARWLREDLRRRLRAPDGDALDGALRLARRALETAP